MVLETFDANGSKYEIRLSSNGTEFEIRAFNASGPANGYSYHVTLSPMSLT
jgi:hypothetical protein